ncbi:28733_t:CDS:1, partial [Racocetra persica]
GTCRDCSNKEDTKNADLFFEIGGADCLDCPDGDNGKNESGEEK